MLCIVPTPFTLISLKTSVGIASLRLETSVEIAWLVQVIGFLTREDLTLNWCCFLPTSLQHLFIYLKHHITQPFGSVINIRDKTIHFLEKKSFISLHLFQFNYIIINKVPSDRRLYHYRFINTFFISYHE